MDLTETIHFAPIPLWALITTTAGFILGSMLLGRATTSRRIAALEADLEHYEAFARDDFTANVVEPSRRYLADPRHPTDNGFAGRDWLPATTTAEAPAVPVTTDTGSIILPPMPVVAPWWQRPLLRILAWWETTRPGSPEAAARRVEPDWDREFEQIVAGMPRPPADPVGRGMLDGPTGEYNLRELQYRAHW